MYFIYKYLFNLFNYIIYLEILNNDRFLSNIIIDKIIYKGFINIFVINIYANAINLIFERIETNFKT